MRGLQDQRNAGYFRARTRRADNTVAKAASPIKSRLPPPPLLPFVPGSLLTLGLLPEDEVPPEDPEPLLAPTACTHEAVTALVAMEVRLHEENWLLKLMVGAIK